MAKLYVIIRTSSVNQSKPKFEVADIIRRRPFVELPITEIGSPYFYYHTNLTHPTDSKDQYYIRLRWLNNGQISEARIVAHDNEKTTAATHMETDVVNYLAHHDITSPIYRKYDNDGTVRQVSGVKTSQGENVWWEIMAIEMAVLGGQDQELEEDDSSGYLNGYGNDDMDMSR